MIQDVSIDTANEASAAVYAQNSTQWLPWFRTVAGLRVDQFWYDVSSELTPANSGSGSQHLVSPKFSMIFSPTAATDVFINYGRGYHSNDIRGATETVDPLTGEPIAKVKVLVPGTGYEVGFKTATLIPGLQFSASLWQLDLASELVYDGDTGTNERAVRAGGAASNSLPTTSRTRPLRSMPTAHGRTRASETVAPTATISPKRSRRLPRRACRSTTTDGRSAHDCAISARAC